MAFLVKIMRVKTGRKKMIIFASLVVVLATIGALLMWRDIRSAPRIEPAALLTASNDAIILDVRSEQEYAHGHVPGAVRAPFWSAQNLHDLNIPPDALVIVYCELGPRAAWAKWTLQRAGLRNVRYLDGHMAGWREAKLRQEVSIRQK